MTDPVFENITPDTARSLIADGTIGSIIDTRELHEWVAERIAVDSALVPVPSGEAVVRQRIEQLALPKDVPVLVHCRSGARSLRVMPQIAAYGFRKIYHLPSGILGWKAAGLPIFSGDAKP